jgi:hypothetical protein
LLWNVLYIFVITTFSGVLPWNNLVVVSVVLIAALSRQIRHHEKLVSRYDNGILVRFNGTTTRYFEYSLTAPILMISVHNIVTNGQGWTAGVAYVGMCVTNLLGIPLHKIYEDLKSMTENNGLSTRNENKRGSQSNTSPKIQKKLRMLMLVLLIASWNAFYSSWYVYLRETAVFWEQLPDPIKALIVCLPLFFLSFGIVGTTFYAPMIWDGRDIWVSHAATTKRAPLKYEDNPKASGGSQSLSYNNKRVEERDIDPKRYGDTQGENAVHTSNWMDVYFDSLSVTVKVFVVLIVLTSDEFRPRVC